MPKKQKRFKSEKTILKAIDEQEAKRVAASIRANELEAAIKAIAWNRNTPATEETYDMYRKDLASAERSIKLAETKKETLGKALSAYRTMLLPMPLNDDNSVVL